MHFDKIFITLPVAELLLLFVNWLRDDSVRDSQYLKDIEGYIKMVTELSESYDDQRNMQNISTRPEFFGWVSSTIQIDDEIKKTP